MSELIKLNDLQQNPQGVYCQGGAETQFNYSDGEQSEQYLYQVLSQAQDISSDSAELQAKIVDWPSEYHLTCVRANILRCLDLTHTKRILELGGGCGSITRYLAEQENALVDSVEGSPKRAALAALRCKGLDNVTICSGNFNDLILPSNYYDMVVFVGVTEYAGRFSQQKTDQAALQQLLRLAHGALKETGVSVIAIENRVGLKYMLGASEDHYGVPYIGIDNYPNSTGIRTYTKTEWHDAIDKSPFSQYRFLFPFPDYKIPTVVMDEATSAKGKEVAELLKHCVSRDYCRPFCMGEKEVRLWSALADADTLKDHANSFLIILGTQDNALEALTLTGAYSNEAAEVDAANESVPVSESEPLPTMDNSADAVSFLTRIKSRIKRRLGKNNRSA